MRVRTRILAGYTTASLLILGLGAAILFTINTVSPVVDELDREVTALGRAVSLSGFSGRIVSLRTEVSRTAYQFVLAQDIAYERRYERASRELSEIFEQAIKKSDSEDDATIFRNLRGTSLRLGTSEKEMINLARAKKIEQAKALAQSEDYVELNAAFSDFVAILANRKQAHSSDVFSRLIDVSRTTQTNRDKLNTLARVTAVSIVLILMANIVIGDFIAGSISRPLTLLKEGAVAIGKGDLDQRIGMSRTDEVGEVARALDQMAEELQTTLVSRDELVREVSERKAAQENLTELAAALRRQTAELRDAQDQLLRKERLAAVGQLTATVSHELRNPLGTIRASIFSISKKVRDKGLGVDQALDRVERNITRCDDIIEDLLEFSRVRELAREATAFDGWLDGVLDEQRIPDGVALRRDLGAGVELDIDPERLRRAVINLIDNACQAVTDGAADRGRERAVAVETRAADGHVELAVADTGPGIPADVLPKVFEPLFSTKSFGVGLGLLTVKQIVEQHGGGIEIFSEEGRGTRVVLWLPTEASGQQQVVEA